MLSNIKAKFLRSIRTKKLNVFGLFLILSFLFLVMAKLSKTYTDTITYTLIFKDVPEEQSIVAASDSVIKVIVKTYGFNLVSHQFYKHSILVDFKKEVKITKDAYIWKTKQSQSKISTQLSESINIVSIQPDSVVFSYETMAVKTVPIQLEATFDYTSGYDVIERVLLQPDSVKVIGPKKSIDKIKVIKTKAVAFTDIHQNIKQEVPLMVDPSIKDLKLGVASTTISGDVQKFTEGSFEVPVSIINLPSNLKINYFPKTVLVSYYVSLNNYKNINALDFKIECDYNDVKNSQRTSFTPKIVAVPKAVKSAKLKQDKVEFIIIE